MLSSRRFALKCLKPATRTVWQTVSHASDSVLRQRWCCVPQSGVYSVDTLNCWRMRGFFAEARGRKAALLYDSVCMILPAADLTMEMTGRHIESAKTLASHCLRPMTHIEPTPRSQQFVQGMDGDLMCTEGTRRATGKAVPTLSYPVGRLVFI